MPLDAHGADRLYLGFLYSVTINDAPEPVAGFTEVSGLVIETEIETLREGGVNGHEHQFVGATKYSSHLVLKRGIGDVTYLWDWYTGVLKGKIERRNVAIELRDRQGKPGLRWVFSDACPVKWTGPELRAAAGAVAFESLDLVHRGLQFASSPGADA